jgi:hypothetical protein
MQRLTDEYRTSLLLAAANAVVPFDRRVAPHSRGSGARRRSSDRDDHRGLNDYRDFNDHRDLNLEDFDADGHLDYRDLSAADYDDRPTYWYWSYDQPDAGL